MHYYAVHSRQKCVGRTVGRTVGRMRPIWRVIAAITPMRRPHASAYAPTFITRRSASVRRIKNAPRNKGNCVLIVYKQHTRDYILKINISRPIDGEFHLLVKDLREIDQELFFKYFLMNSQRFDQLLFYF